MKKMSILTKIILTWLFSIVSISLMTLMPSISAWYSGLATTEPGAINDQGQPNLFVDLPDLLLLEVDFFQDSSPVIVQVTQLEQGRITPDISGEATIEIMDKNGVSLYKTSTTPVFFFGEPPIIHSQISKVIIMPNFSTAHSISVIYKNWKAEKIINGN